jgi:uncharacterized cupredoxin-like copper-binding protein
MSGSTIEEPQLELDPEAVRDADLRALQIEVARQGREIRASQQAFSIFAVLAFAIALATLLAVAFKLQAHPTVHTTIIRGASAATPPKSAAPAAPPRTVGVTLREFKLNPTANTAAAGKVTFHVSNTGKITHEFVVLRTSHPANALPLVHGRADESGNVGETGDVKPGQSKSLTLNLPAGHYVLVCNLPGHYLAGQHADLTVR